VADAYDTLEQVKADLVTSLAAETAYQAAHGPRASYTSEGKSYDWPGWRDSVLRQIETINRTQTMLRPKIIVSRGRA
jgi:hypothetical protein